MATGTTPKNTFIEKAIKKIGGFTATAKLIKEKKGEEYSYQAVQSWVNSGRMPAKYALVIEQGSGISASDLCPDVFQVKVDEKDSSDND